MKGSLVILAAAIVLSGCASATDGVIVVENSSSTDLSDVQVNVTQRYHDGRLLTAPVDAFDQIQHTGPLKVGETRKIPYRSAAEFNIDILATWGSGSTARFNEGYVEGSFKERHTAEIHDGVILLDGAKPSPIQAFPEENQWRRTVTPMP